LLFLLRTCSTVIAYLPEFFYPRNNAITVSFLKLIIGIFNLGYLLLFNKLKTSIKDLLSSITRNLESVYPP